MLLSAGSQNQSNKKTARARVPPTCALRLNQFNGKYNRFPPYFQCARRCLAFGAVIFVVAAPYSPAAFHSRGPISPILVLFTAVLHLLVFMGLTFHAHFFGRMRPWGCAASGARPRVGAPRLPTPPPSREQSKTFASRWRTSSPRRGPTSTGAAIGAGRISRAQGSRRRSSR